MEKWLEQYEKSAEAVIKKMATCWNYYYWCSDWFTGEIDPSMRDKWDEHCRDCEDCAKKDY
jgi:hypothetical protein